MKAVRKRASTHRRTRSYPIAYWSYSSLVSYLRNPLAWHKRYVEKVYDIPSSPAGVIGRAAHYALEQFYTGTDKEIAVRQGYEYLQRVPDEDIAFGVARSKKAQRAKRVSMEREYLQAIGFYLARPPRHQVLGAEVRGMASVPGVPIPIKAISDLVVLSRGNPGAVDIVDHKFVDSWSKSGMDRPLFLLQAIFNYYTVRELYGKPVKRFIVIECKKSKNKDGRSQLRKYVLRYEDADEAFVVFHRLLKDATEELLRRRQFLPNPSDMFEGEHSFDLYRLGLGGTSGEEGEPDA